MPQSLVHNLVHLIYSTKDREPNLRRELRNELYAYQSGIFRKHDSACLAIGGVADHVHALFLLSKNIALKSLVQQVKKSSTDWVKASCSSFRGFAWQRGYAAFSVSQSQAQRVRKYIANQEDHHRRVSFQDELRTLFRKHGVSFDEDFVWD